MGPDSAQARSSHVTAVGAQQGSRIAAGYLNSPALYDRPGNPYLGPDGRDWPDDIEATYAGYSIGRWVDEDGDGR